MTKLEWCTDGALHRKKPRQLAINYSKPLNLKSLIFLLLGIEGYCKLQTYDGLLIHWS